METNSIIHVCILNGLYASKEYPYPPQGGLMELSRGWESQKLKYFKESMIQTWTFQRERGRGYSNKIPIYGKSTDTF